MKALTVWEPWATLIMIGAKPWEWRGYPAPKSVIGRRIVIHAGKRPVKPSEVGEIMAEIAAGQSSLIAEKALPILLKAHMARWPLAHALGTVLLGDPIQAVTWAEQHLKPGYDSNRIDHHQWAWPVSDPQPFNPPIPRRGAQGFWTY